MQKFKSCQFHSLIMCSKWSIILFFLQAGQSTERNRNRNDHKAVGENSTEPELQDLRNNVEGKLLNVFSVV